jgi:Holliday junction resolvase RusA-like endonuclease
MVETAMARDRAKGIMMTACTLLLDLPLPPSVNRCFANVPGKGRVRSSIYRRWQKAALAEIRAQARGIIFRGTFRLAILASDQGLTRRRDADNLGKAICDALTKAGTIADDCHHHLRSIALVWTPKLAAGACRVHVIEMAAAPISKPAKAARISRRIGMAKIGAPIAPGVAEASRPVHRAQAN